MNSTTVTAYARSGHLIRPGLSLLTLAAGLSLAACSSLPTAGPQAKDIRDEYHAQASAHPFELVDVTARTVEVLKQRSDPSLASRFGDDAPAQDLVIGPGDGLAVSIWETGSEPLFSPGPGAAQQAATAGSARVANIPEQIVGSDGCISIPFAGRVPVAGRTTIEVQQAIERALAGKANKPQVLVNLSRNSSSTVTVVGEVTGGSRVPLTTHGERLLEVLASAGGIRAPTYETQIQLTRGKDSAKVPLLRVLSDAKENVTMRPGDNLIVTRQAESFTAFGATGRNAQINFDASTISLTEAVAKAGGLQDLRANPRGVFLFRFEPRSLVANLVANSAVTEADSAVPVVYEFDLTKAGTYFLAQSFEMRDHDILYVSNAPATELQKFLQLLGALTQPAIEGAVVNNSLK